MTEGGQFGVGETFKVRAGFCVASTSGLRYLFSRSPASLAHGSQFAREASFTRFMRRSLRIVQNCIRRAQEVLHCATTEEGGNMADDPASVSHLDAALSYK